ncbi:hypothetical protein AB5N19_03416 [Seiridium cardinale]
MPRTRSTAAAAAAPAAPAAPAPPAAPAASAANAPRGRGRAPAPSDSGDSSWEDSDSGEDFDEEAILKTPPPKTPPRRQPKAKSSTALDKERDQERILLDHFRRLPDELKNVLILTAKSLPKRSSRTGNWLKDNRPVPTRQMALSWIYDPPLTGEWEEQDEETAKEEWENSAERMEILQFPKKNLNNYMLPLWKCMLRLHHVLPSCFLGPGNSLMYGNSTLADGSPSTNWSPLFCRRLCRLCCHGIFQGRIEMLQLALMWASMCRQDYRGHVPWNHAMPDKLVGRLLRAMAGQDGTISIPELHELIREKEFPPGDDYIVPYSTTSALLQAIEKRAFKKKAGPHSFSDGKDRIAITGEDLRLVIRAANAVQACGYPAFRSMAESSRVILHSFQTYGYPRSFDELNILREKVGLTEYRQYAWAAKNLSDGESEGPSAQGESQSESASEAPPPKRQRTEGQAALRAPEHMDVAEDDPFLEDNVFSEEQIQEILTRAPGSQSAAPDAALDAALDAAAAADDDDGGNDANDDFGMDIMDDTPGSSPASPEPPADSGEQVPLGLSSSKTVPKSGPETMQEKQLETTSDVAVADAPDVAVADAPDVAVADAAVAPEAMPPVLPLTLPICPLPGLVKAPAAKLCFKTSHPEISYEQNSGLRRALADVDIKDPNEWEINKRQKKPEDEWFWTMTIPRGGG